MIPLVRGLLAVVVGYVILTIGVDLLFALWFTNPDRPITLHFMEFAVAFTFVLALVAGYAAAWVAQRAEMKHAAWLAALIVVMDAIAILRYHAQEPAAWFEPANLLAGVLGILLGAKLRQRARRST